jgi:hypothetical protein
MSYVYYNPNPLKISVGDCTIRAISKALNISWDETYLALANLGFEMYDMPSANRVWGHFLRINGFKKYQLPDMCPACYTIKDFCYDFPIGIYVVGTGEHVVCVINGSYFDSWDSGNEIPIYYFKRG